MAPRALGGYGRRETGGRRTGESGTHSDRELNRKVRALAGLHAGTLDTSARPENCRVGDGGPGGRPRCLEGRCDRALAGLSLDLRRLDLPTFMGEVARRVREVLGAEFCEVLELVVDGERLLRRAGDGWEENLIGRGSAGTALEPGAVLSPGDPIVIEDAHHRARSTASGISTLICANGRTFGMLGACSTTQRCFTEEEVGFLKDAAELLGVAVERDFCERSYRRALEKERLRAEVAEKRYGILQEANVVFTTVPDGLAALVAVARLAVPALADWCFVELVEDDGTPRPKIRRLVAAPSGGGEAEERMARELTRHYPLDPNSPHGTPKVLRTGRPELIPEVRDEILQGCDGAYLRWMRDLTPSSYLCVPLHAGLRLVGSMGFVLSAAHSGRHYGPGDLVLAESLARGSALVVANLLEMSAEPGHIQRLRESPSHGQRVIRSAGSGGPALTPRQLEVLRLLDSGMRVHQIKSELKLSEPTVRTHIRAILRAFGACSQLEALHRARGLGFVGGISQDAGRDLFR